MWGYKNLNIQILFQMGFGPIDTHDPFEERPAISIMDLARSRQIGPSPATFPGSVKDASSTTTRRISQSRPCREDRISDDYDLGEECGSRNTCLRPEDSISPINRRGEDDFGTQALILSFRHSILYYYVYCLELDLLSSSPRPAVTSSKLIKLINILL